MESHFLYLHETYKVKLILIIYTPQYQSFEVICILIKHSSIYLLILYITIYKRLYVTLVDLAVYIFVRLVTRGRYTPCHSQFLKSQVVILQTAQS